MKPIWEEKNIPYAVWTPDGVRRTNYTYTPSKAAQHNATVYAHVCFTISDFDLTSQYGLKSPDDRKSRDFFCKRHCKYSLFFGSSFLTKLLDAMTFLLMHVLINNASLLDAVAL